MNDRGCLARASLRTSLHLACVGGPDIGLVLAPGTIGRAGDVPLSCPSVARKHASFSTRASHALLRPAPGAPAIRARRLLPVRARSLAHTGAVAGTRIRLGEDTFEVRPRPHHLTWPGITRRGGGSPRPASLMRVFPVVSALLMVAFMGWRFHSVLPRSPLASRMAMGVAALGLAVAAVLAWRAHRRRLGWDGATLALVLASLPSRGSVPPSLRAAVWPGKATRLTRRVVLAPSGQGASSAECASVGIAGAHGAECALWCAGQVAAQAGGARVWWNSSAPVVLGHAGIDIHVSASEECPHCARSPRDAGVLHVGYATCVEDLPSWCARVCVTDDAPVCPAWWWTVTRMDRQDALPTRFRWRAEEARGRTGTLGVSIGQSQEGPVSLDLVSDGPHALVAGCTGSGKSEALLVWLAAIAHAYSPQRVRFILIDYKGGSTFARLRELPHTQDVLTDLDAGATTRALEGIAHVLRDRERRLSDLGFPDLAAWERAHEEDPRAAPPPPARLIVAIDEFRALAQAHSSSMEVLLRLAAQGRSLGLHLIAATQRPSGAVSAQMRANMDIRLALRCLSAADSTDILEDARAASLPRIPGRAVLSGVGTIQLAYMPDIVSVVSECRRAWPTAAAVPLWAPPLPGALTWEDVDSQPAATAPSDSATSRSAGQPERGHRPVRLGLVEGIEAHSPLAWDGGSIEIQASAHEAGLASRWALCLASRIAEHAQIPLHVIGEDAPPSSASHLREEDIGAIDLLEGACEHGPLVLALTDIPALRAALAHAVSAPQAEALWASLLGRARRAGVVVVAAHAGRFTPSGAALGAFSTRLVRARDADEALHAGIAPADLRTLGDNQALLARPGERTRLVAIPTGLSAASECAGGASAPWRIPSPALSARLVSNSSSVALIGAEWAPLAWAEDRPWIIVGQEEDARIAERIHAALGWSAPRIADVVPEAAWTRITRWDGHRVLALNPSTNVVRALTHVNSRHPLSIGARRWDNSSGLICDDGILTTIQLTTSSVNT